MQPESLAGEALTLPSANTAALIRAANKHDDRPVIAPNGNRIPESALPLIRQPHVGPPDAVNPLGRHFDESYGGGNGGDE
jgi:hypothetical protein